jgi:hypothetical protein
VKTSPAPHSPIVRLSSVSSCPTVIFHPNPPRKYESLQPSFKRVKRYLTSHRRHQWRKMAIDTPLCRVCSGHQASSLAPPPAHVQYITNPHTAPDPTTVSLPPRDGVEPPLHREGRRGSLLAGANDWSTFSYQFPTSPETLFFCVSSRVGPDMHQFYFAHAHPHAAGHSLRSECAPGAQCRTCIPLQRDSRPTWATAADGPLGAAAVVTDCGGGQPAAGGGGGCELGAAGSSSGRHGKDAHPGMGPLLGRLGAHAGGRAPAPSHFRICS